MTTRELSQALRKANVVHVGYGGPFWTIDYLRAHAAEFGGQKADGHWVFPEDAVERVRAVENLRYSTDAAVRKWHFRVMRLLAILGSEELLRSGMWNRLAAEERKEIGAAFSTIIARAGAVSRTSDDVAWLLHVLGRKPTLTLLDVPT